MAYVPASVTSNNIVFVVITLFRPDIVGSLLANECKRVQGSGMSAQQKACCDSFVYISQHGSGTASLNVTVAASIILHRFAAWKAENADEGTER